MKLRKWQDKAKKEAVAAFLNGETLQTIAGAVGSGKSATAIEIGADLYSRGIINFIVIVAPHKTVVEDFQKSFEKRLEARFDGLYGSAGIAVTNANKNFLTDHAIKILRSENTRSLLIIDEVHHNAGECEEVANTWGRKLLRLKELATFTLCLSGTLFRSDKRAISCIEYDGSEVKTNVSYTLAQGIKDKINKYPRVMAYDFAGEQKIQHLVDEKRLDLQSLLKKPEIFSRVIADANTTLKQVKEHIKNAAGLVVCVDIEHARKVKHFIQSLGEDVELVTSREEAPHHTIEKFKTNNMQWIVSVGMIAEGTDIQRIQTIVYLTNKMTETIFVQIFGRGLRINTLYPQFKQDAWLYCLAHPTLISLAETLAEELQDHEVLFKKDLLKKQRGKGKETGQVSSESEYVIAQESDFEIQSSLTNKDDTESRMLTPMTPLAPQRQHLQLSRRESRDESYNYQLSKSEIVVKLQHYTFYDKINNL